MNKLPTSTVKSYLPGMSLQLELEDLEQQEERRDLVMVLQLAEDSLQRMKHLDDRHDGGDDDDAEATRKVLLKKK